MKQQISISILAILALGACKKEYVTNEYNEYVTNEYYTTNEYIYNKEYYTEILSLQPEITDDIRPEYLKSGDTVAICATSNAVTAAQMNNGKSILKSWGLNVIEADNLYDVDGRYAGTESARIIGLQKMIDNPNVKAIIAARGGYGCAQIIDKINFDAIKSNPKWIVGYSDVTVLHAALNNLGIETIHGAMINGIDKQSANSLKDALFGNLHDYSIATNSNCIEGKAEGRLVGGNLSIIYSLGGTLFDLNTKGAILFIEDTGESNYSLDRMLTNLKLSGKLNSIKGVVIGQFTGMTQGIDKSVEEIIHEKLEDLNIPIFYNIESGHGTPNLSLMLGRKVKLDIDKNTAKLTFTE